MTEAAAIARLDSRALIRVDGDDWRSFLQNLITQDVEGLKPGEARFGALLTPQGRLLYDMFVVGRDDGVLLDVEASHRAALIQRLMLYRLRAKVAISADDGAVTAAWPAPGGPGWVADPRLPALGARYYGDGPAPNAAESAYEAHRLSLGVPGPADWGSDRTYPIEANFDLLNGVDFQKGCFVGQETTSRMKRRGQIKNRMLPVDVDGPTPAAGAELLAGDLRAGEILAGSGSRVMALVRLDRISGPLTVDGHAAAVERPAWIGGE